VVFKGSECLTNYQMNLMNGVDYQWTLFIIFLNLILDKPDLNEINVILGDLSYGLYLFELKESKNNMIIHRLKVLKN